jgi:NADH-quinone oxidoreductase subunit M
VPWAAILAVFGVILAAIYLLWAYQRMFHGPVEGRAVGIPDLTRREIVVVAPLIALMLAIGLYPQPLYERVNPSVEAVVSDVRAATDVSLDDEEVGP